VLVGTRISVGAISGLDVVLACAMLALTVMAGWLWRARGAPPGIAALLASSAVVMPIVVGLWVPEIVGSHVRETAAALVQNFGDGPYVFVGNDISLPLCWAMKHAIGQVESESEALAAAREHPSLAVLALGKDKRTPPALGAPFVPKLTIQYEDRVLKVYRLRGK
jgi:hypothetical protein